MGLTSTASGDGTQLCVFDLRRGQQEGQELDKILFFHPADCPILLQLSVIGLCEGIVTFTRSPSRSPLSFTISHVQNISPEEDCEVIESEKHSHVFYQAEPDIWMVLVKSHHCYFIFLLNNKTQSALLHVDSAIFQNCRKLVVVEKTKDNEPTWRCGALQGILKEAHSLFTMFHGPIRALLDRQPGAELARGNLRTFLTDYLSGWVKLSLAKMRITFSPPPPPPPPPPFWCSGTDFAVSKKLQLPTFRDSLKERGTVQMLTVSREVALEVQDDTLNLYTYAVMRLTPRALSSNASSWSYLRKGTFISAGPTASSSNGTTAGERYHSRSRDTSPGGQNQINYNFRPLLREKLSKGKDGFVIADFTATEGRAAVPLTPILWFQQAEEHMHLCIYQHKNLTVLLLIPASSLVNGQEGIAHVKKHLLENASQKIATVEQKLARGWGGENAYHVGGYRYLLVDPDRRVSRASPPGKVTTLSRDSLLSLNRLRQEVDLEKSRHNRSDPSHDKDFEACIRTKNNAWVIAKVTRGKELYMALEKGGETLLYASTAVEKFSNRYCEGAFSTD
ncbi:hypothetical protein PR202_gb03158 [Eleusine coracana subsp. coracana]|uniref:CCZ1/INTU/HSP4 first Longin domain-containing protein n=1 Tax=Eleusine coracana subsp. coracana TaxID=191504 RepID=A0AAV5E125_ELECO|nr:hypothetical protein PR202_gb03158 [Eleusine coracana subsp. coracana]